MVYFWLTNCVIMWNDFRKTYGPSENPITLVLAMFSNRSYREITSENVKKNGGMIDSCQVHGEVCNMSERTEVCQWVMSVRRRHGGTEARWCLGGAQGGKEERWCNDGAPGGTEARWCLGNAPGGTVALWCHNGAPGGTVVSRWRTRWQGGTVV